MAVNVNGGALEVALGLNTDQFEEDLLAGFQDGIKDAGKLESALNKAATGGAQSIVSKLEEAVKIGDQISPLIEKGLSGIDPTKLNKLNDQLSTSTTEFEQLQKIVQFVGENLNNLDLNPEELSQLTAGVNQIKTAFDGLSEKEKSTLAYIRSLKDELSKQSPTGALFGDTLKQATALQERIKNVQAELKLSSSSAPGLVATGQAVRGLVAGFTALQGAMALVSDGNEDVQKTTQSLIASMSILQGISEVMEVIDKNSSLNVFLTAQSRKSAAAATTEQVIATEALAVAEGTQAAATEGALVAQEGLNTAMKANPAGILLVGLTAVVAAIQFFSKETKDATDDMKQFNLQLDRIGQDANKIVDQIKFLTQFNSEIARSRGSIESDITRENIKGYLNEAGAYEQSIERKVNATKDFFKQFVDVSNVSINNQQEAEEALKRIQNVMAQPGFEKFGDQFKKNFELAEKVAVSVVSDFKSIQGLDQQVQLENQRLVAQTLQESLRSAQASAEARLILAKKNTEQELKLQIAAINTRATAELNVGNLTTGERQKILAQQQKDIKEAQDRFRILQLNDQKALLQAQLNGVKEGSAAELKLRIDLINQTTAIELSEAGLTQARITEIKSNAAKQIADITKKFNQEVLESEIESQISVTRAKLAAAKENTQLELDLQKDLIDEQAQLQIVQAKDQIDNEKLLQAKISEILADALAKRTKLQDDYVKAVLNKQFEELDRQAVKLNDPLQKILSDPRSSGNDKYAAQLKINQNELDKMREKQRLLAKQIGLGKGDVFAMVKAYEDLNLAISKVNSESENLKAEKFGKAMKKLGADITSVSSSLGQLASALKGSNEGLSDTLDTLAEIGNIAGSVVSAVGQFAVGDIAGGISSTVKAISGIFAIGKAAQESRRKAIAEIDEFYARIKAGELELTQTYRDRARDLVLLNKIRIQGLQDENKLLEDQKRAVQDQYNIVLAQLQAQSFVADEVTKKYGGVFGIGRKTKAVEVFQSLAGKSFEELEKLFSEGRLTGKAKELFEQLQKIKQEGVDIDALLAQNALTFKEAITGTNTESIADSIVNGFKQGLRSAADFADTFKELMQNSLLQALQLKFLEGPLEDFFNEFASLTDSGNQLTSGEISDLQKMYNTIIDNASKQFEDLQQVAGINLSTPGSQKNSLTGAIKGITEQQAELLAGQFGGLRITALESLNVARTQLTALNMIEANTGATVMRLASLLQKFDSYETGSKQLYVKIQ